MDALITMAQLPTLRRELQASQAEPGPQAPDGDRPVLPQRTEVKIRTLVSLVKALRGATDRSAHAAH
ncbi:hypothetical protein GCM10022226_11100 [Sphaerisporangium flaviroseum]|uniref:Uncharacterized protein n=1 Tax=Sphaerisporangium flaviroseum TaxID=509199 RepID=A0ABP7HIJ3_9ACTN